MTGIREIPPTAGLPLKWTDFASAIFPARSKGATSNSPLAESRACFEDLLASYLSLDCLDVYSSGTLCLSIAFETARELSGRNKIILPAYTCPLVAIAAHAAGMEIVLCDTAVDSFEMDLDVLASLCDENVAAVVPTDIAGLPANVKQVKQLASACGAFTIEDAAQALGAKRDGKSVGAYADMAVYSFAVGKGLSLYDGGALFVADDAVRRKSRELAKRRLVKKPLLSLKRQLELVGLWLLYNPFGLYFAYGNELRYYLKSGELERAVGDIFDLDIPSYEFDKFRKRIGAALVFRLPEFVACNRRRALKRLEMAESRLSGFRFLSEAENSEGSWPFMMLLAESREIRDAALANLWTKGLGVTRLFINQLSGYEFLKPLLKSPANTPNARSFAERSFSISNSHFLEDWEFDAILSQLADSTSQKKCTEIFS